MKPDWFDKRPLVLLVVFTVLFFWRLALSDQFTFLDSPDLTYQVLPWYQVQARSWHNGEFPLWDPYQWVGQSLIGQMQPGAAFPLNWPLFLAPLDAGYINLRYIHWHFVLMHLLAGLFMYALARELGRSRYASLAAALAFACSGYVGTTVWPQMLNGAIWIPLVFLLFHRLVKAEATPARWTYAVCCGATVGMSLLSGHHQTPIFMVFALTGLFLYFFIQRRRQSAREAGRLLGFFVVVGLFAATVGALQLIPAVEYAQNAYRWVGAPEPVTLGDTVPYWTQHDQRLHPFSLVGTVIPHVYLRANTFVGFFCLSMAVLAVALAWSDRWVRVYSFLGLGALVYGFGPFSMLHGWLYALVPFADKARSPSHAVFVFQFALFLLAAHGIDRFFAQPRQGDGTGRWLRYIQYTLIAFGAVVWASIMHLAVQGKLTAEPGDQFILAAVVAFVLAAVIQGHRKQKLSQTATRLVLVFLMLFEMGSTRWFDVVHFSDPNRTTVLPKLTELRGAMNFLKEQPRQFRFEIKSDEKLPNLGAWEGLEASDGYLASVSRNVYDFMAQDWARGRLLANTVYTVSKERVRDLQVEVYSDPSGWKVFRNPDAYPRAWTEHEVENISMPAGMAGSLPDTGECEGREPVESVKNTPHEIVAMVSMQCSGFVIFADPYYPGWQAYLDGKRVPIYPAYGALRAIAVGAGRHRMEFVYRPRSVYVGAVLTALGLLTTVVLLIVARRRGGLR